jgi:hypothetical protein
VKKAERKPMSRIKKVRQETIQKALTADSRVIATENPEKIAEYYTALVYVEKNSGEKRERERATSQLEELAGIFLIPRNRSRRYAVFDKLGQQYVAERTTEYGKFLWEVHKRFYNTVVEYRT